MFNFYASQSSGEAYRDRRLTTNFELWVEIFCVPTCFHVRIPKPCLSVRLSVQSVRLSVQSVRLSVQSVRLSVQSVRLSVQSVRLSVCLSVPREKKSPWLRRYQSYISNWCINGKVFISTTTWKPKNLIFFKKVLKLNFDLYYDLSQSAEINIQVGLNMHLYVDIGDASSSLWGSTSSYNISSSNFVFDFTHLIMENLCILLIFIWSVYHIFMK